MHNLAKLVETTKTLKWVGQTVCIAANHASVITFHGFMRQCLEQGNFRDQIGFPHI